jgi:hypothetical protein
MADLKPSPALLGKMIAEIPFENFARMINKSGLSDTQIRMIMRVYGGVRG